MKLHFVFLIALIFQLAFSYRNEIDEYVMQEHPSNGELYKEVQKCVTNSSYCLEQENADTVLNLCTKLANEHAQLLLYDRAQQILKRVLQMVGPKSRLGSRVAHVLAALSFSQGNVLDAEDLWKLFDDTDLVSRRSLAAQIVMGGDETKGIEEVVRYSTDIGEKFASFLNPVNVFDDSGAPLEAARKAYSKHNWTRFVDTKTLTGINYKFTRATISEDSDDFILAWLLSEASGSVRKPLKLSELMLSTFEVKHLDAKQRFRLGVGLAKLGLFDLSLKHISRAATPWEAPLYQLRAKLVFSPVHSSIRALTLAVNNFEQQGESVLMKKIPKSTLMIPICNSLNEAALALQALPLLHLAGVASPMYFTVLGHSPVALPVLLGEVYQAMCPSEGVPPALEAALLNYYKGMRNSSSSGKNTDAKKDAGLLVDMSSSSSSSTTSTSNTHGGEVGGGDGFEKDDKTTAVVAAANTEREFSDAVKNKFRVGVVAGSFDGTPGRIMIGLLEAMTFDDRRDFEIIAMCFPTPRDTITDRVNALFDRHINLSPSNKTQAMERIMAANVDFILFADAGLDSRSFALSHERLAMFQGMLWGWGGTLGVPTADFYFMPEIMWSHARCPDLNGGHKQPQELFSEQVILLEGLPNLPRPLEVSQEEMRSVMRNRYLLALGNNRTHLYLFPGSVKHFHPKFDAAVDVILKTDPLAIVVLAVSRNGRDSLPTTHEAVRHDLMHPTMPAAAVTKFRHRLRTTVGNNIARVRVLPPLEESLLRALQRSAVALLDSYPVGMHTQLLDAMMDQVPVISAFSLQECTNSHAYSLARYFNISSAYMGNAHRDAVWQERSRARGTSAGFATSSIVNIDNTGASSPSLMGVAVGDVATGTAAGASIITTTTTTTLDGVPSIEATNSPGGENARERKMQQKKAVQLLLEKEMARLDDFATSDVETDNYDWLYPNSPEELGVLAVRISREESVRNAFRVTHKSTIDRLVQKGKASSISQGAQLLAFFRKLRKGYKY